MLSLQHPSSGASSTQTRQITPNFLPCRTAHTGAVNVSERYWKPMDSERGDGSKVAYFRGRKLLGRSVPLCEGYRGVLARTTENEVAKPDFSSKGKVGGEEEEEGDKCRLNSKGSRKQEKDNGRIDGLGEAHDEDGVRSVDEEVGVAEEEEEEEADEPVRIMEEVGSFDEVMIWGHEAVPGSEDIFVRGMQELVGWQAGIHSYEKTGRAHRK